MEELINNINALNNQGFTFWVEQDKRLRYMLRQSYPEKDEALVWVKENKKKLLELLKFNVKAPKTSLNPYIYKYNVDTQHLSFAQERLWFIERYEQGTNAYNIPIISKLSNEASIELLERSIKAIVARHEILRTVIKEDNAGSYYQEVLDTDAHPFEVLKVKCTSKEELDEYLRQDVAHIYDLSNEYPIRVRIYSLESSSNKNDKNNQKDSTANTPAHILSIVIHHIAFDGWSTDIFLNELKEYYRHFEAEEAGLTSQLNLPPLTIQYKDFALWQRSYLTGDVLEKQLSYWKSKLEGYETLHLHADYTRPTEMDYEGRNISFELERDLSLHLREAAKSLGVSLYSLMLSCYYLMLRVYTGQDDIVIGSPVVNRHYTQIEHLIGFFVNTLALRVNIGEDFVENTSGNSTSSTRPTRTLRDFIKHVGSEVIEAQLHQDLPFEKLVEELNVPKDTSRHPVFQVMFSLNSFGGEERDNIRSSQSGQKSIITPYIAEGEDSGNIAKFDLETFIDDGSSNGVLKGGFIYRINLYKEETIKGFINTYKEILTQVAEAISDEVTKESFKIEDLTYLTKEEKDLILTRWNSTDVSYPHNKTIHQLFEEQVEKTPDRIAAHDKHLSITYDELNKKANQLARYLKKKGVCIDDPVVVAMDRSIDLIITILAISKAGGVYVPTDLHAPAERNIYICQNAQASIVIANSKLEWLDSVSSEIIMLHEIESDASKHNSTNLDIHIDSLNLSYIIFTSGSTGLPKGVMVSHEGMINHLFCKIRDLYIDESDIIAQTATQIFDISIWQLLTSVTTGGKVVVISEEIIKDPKQFIKTITREKITILELVPEYAHSLTLYMQSHGSNVFKFLKHLLVTGEALKNEVCQEIFNISNKVSIVNAYGPTECSDDVTHYHYNLDQHINTNFPVIPIGKVLQNLQLYVLNSNLLPVPRGAAGELYVGGVGLARGYLNRPALTSQTFIASPFSNKPGERLYKTGDLVRYLPDGNIEFIGRVDHQVKIRGFRIELGEIESTISSVNGVKQVIVLAREDEPGQKRLVAYVVPDNQLLLDEEDAHQQEFIADIRKECIKNLPDYMRPSQIMLLAEIPLTPNGKIDRKALPKPEGREGLEAYQAPEGLIENSLAFIWKELLRVERVGRNDNFFHLGGHSLIATRLISKIRQNESVEVPLRAVFEHPVLSDLAHVIEQEYQSAGVLPPITRVKHDGTLPLSFAQQRLWFIEQLLEDKTKNLYNMQTCIRIQGSLNIEALEQTLSYLVNRHETLRTKIIMKGEHAFQCILPSFKFELVKKNTTEENVYEDIKEIINIPFNLEETLFKGQLLKISNSDYVLVLTFHHMISDGWSIGVFNREFSHCYKAFAREEDPNLPELEIQYADYSIWQREWFKEEVLQKQLEYWTHQLSDVPSIDLSFKSREEESNYDADEYLYKIPKATLDKLKIVSHKEEVTLFMLLLAAFQGLLSKYVNQQDIAIGTPIANRRANETEGLIGFFVNTLVIRSSIDVNNTFRDFLQRTKQTILSAYEHQDIPFEQLVETLNVDRDLRKHSLFQLFFVLQNNEMSDIALHNLDVSNIFYANIKKSIFDLALNIVETEEGLYVNFEYSKHLFDKKYIQEIAEKYNRYIEAILADPNTLMSNISILDNTELAQLATFNNTDAPYPRQKTIHQLFEEEAEKTPDKVALIYENKQLSYGTLNNRSNQLSHLLRKEGVVLDNRVGISAPRGLELVIGMLATLKAGGAYIPLDPEYPEDRLNYMLEDAGVDVLLTVGALSSLYQNYKGKIIYIDDYDYLAKPTTNLALTVPPEALAYVIYTSGSTGKPKGVACNQEAFINRLYWGWTKNNFHPDETMCLQSSISFVDSTWDIFGSLAIGARLVMYKEELSKSIEDILDQCSANKVTRITLVPSLLKELIIQAQENPRILKNAAKIPHWEVTGEQFHTYLAEDFKRLLNRQINFLDCYGATEATSVIYKDFTSTSGAEYTTCLLSNTQIYILDTNLNQVPIGAIGELFIGGVGLARGYLNRPGLTAEKFIANPLPNTPGERLYRTGDLARYLPDGNIEIMGRVDHQVKIRGFRIELGEIESAINQIDGIRNAVVTLDDDSDDHKRLIAYYVAHTPSIENTSKQTHTLVGKWRDMYDQLYSDYKNNEVNTFDISGWNNSYTRLPFSAQEMKEWRDSTVNRINDLNPEAILEIGCGTGLLTFSLVKNCKTYIGADFSSVVIDKLNRGLKSLGIENASLLMAKADEVFDNKIVKNTHIDTIVLNSITQYFPNVDYLDDVLMKSIEILNPRKIFIGDIRDYRLADVLHFSIEMSRIRQNALELDVSTLQNSIKMHVKKEAELLLSPTYFLKLAKCNQKIELIEILPKKGVCDNELNSFRYDVIIHVNQRDISKVQLPLTQKNKDALVFEYENNINVQNLLKNKHPALIVKGYPNKRVWRDYNLNHELNNVEASDISQQEETLIRECDNILSLEDLHSIAKQHGYVLYSHLALEHKDSSSKYDLYFYKDQSTLNLHKQHIFHNYLNGYYQTRFSNNPNINIQKRHVDVTKVRESLLKNLPEYMVPSLFIELAEMPLTPNGKIDRKALPKPKERDGLEEAYQAPEGLIENSLASIWKELLQVERVGRNDNFFHLGGHSLIATRLISKIRQSESVEVPLRAVFEHPVLSDLAHVIEQEYQSAGVLPPITRVKHDGPLPLSFAQQRLWFIEQLLVGNNGLYHIPTVIRIKGNLNEKALKQALDYLVSRHEILRTRLVTDDGIGYQEILDSDLGFSLAFKDLTKSKDKNINSLVSYEISRPFASDEVLCRALCIKLSEQERVLVITFHHIISDGWSVGIFNKELSAAYESYASYKSPDLPALPVQYADYSIWQRSWLSGKILEKQLHYWQEQLQDVSSLELPADRSRPSVQNYKGGYYQHRVSKDTLDKLRKLSQDEGVTLFMVLFSVFSGVLSKLSNQTDIIIGTPIAGRNSIDIEGLIGFFVNTLALRADTSGDPSFKELLHRVEKATLGAYEHQDVPFEQLVEHLSIPRDLNRHPLFQVMFALQNMEITNISMGDLDLQYEYNDEVLRAKFDLTLNAVESSEGLCFGFEYAKDLFDEQTIVRLARYYDQFLTAIITDAEQKLSSISLLDSKELAQLASFNRTDISYPHNKTIHQLFEEQAEKTPDKIALIYENKQLSYGTLNNFSNQLSHLLRKEGVALDTLVGISAPRGLEFVIGILAILKAGGAYVPLDPEYPEERLNYMLEDAGIDVLLTVKELSNLYQHYKGKIIYLDDFNYFNEPAINLALPVPPGALAYVIYTSGSTGRPKGVGITHGSIFNHMKWMVDKYFDQFTPHILQRTNPNFDASVWELFLPLIAEGKMVIATGHKLQNPQEIKKISQTYLVNTIQLVPALIDLLEQEHFFNNLKLRKVFVGGDRLIHKHFNIITKTNTECLVYNLYGPTESTIDSSSYKVLDLLEEMPIGTPISNTQMHILDTNLNQVPIGAIGELFIGGLGLARGYINRPGLTAEKFIANPFSHKPGERLYRTGDLGRYLPDGNIEFIGRVDHQVKIRGFRIELGEIESAISLVNGVKQVIVLAREDEPGQKRLVAYVMPNNPILLNEEGNTKQQSLMTDIRQECSKILPDYMRPSQIMLLTEMPLTPNGKIDRKALPKPEGREGLEAYQPPEGLIENSLASIWKELLQVERVGRNDNFFYLGGHSLIATRLISKIRQSESIEVPLRAVFEHPVLSDLAQVIEQEYQSAGVLPPITRVSVSRKEDIHLSFAQERLWFIERYEQGTNAYNIPIISKLSNEASIELLERSIKAIVARHEILRTVIKEDNAGSYYQEVLDTDAHPFEVLKVKCTSKEELDEYLRQDVAHIYDLSNEYPIRVRIYSLESSSNKNDKNNQKDSTANTPAHILSIVIHHIAFDGWSTDIFLNELKEYYRHFEAEEAGLTSQLNLPPLTIQYKDFALWQRSYLTGDVLEKQLSYWKSKLEGYETLHLHADYTRPTEMDYEGRNISFELERDLSLRLREVAKSLGVSLYSLMLSCYYLMLRVYSGQDDIIIGSPVANRHYSQIEDLIGFFVNTLALRVNIAEDSVESTGGISSSSHTLRDFIKHVGSEVVEAQLHQDLPFEKLVEELNVPKDTSRHPIFQVMFSLHSFGSQERESNQLGQESLITPYTGEDSESIYNIAKFDLETFIDDGSSDGVLRGGFDYRTSLYKEDTIKSFITTYKEILTQVAEALSDEITKESFKIEDLTYLTKEEKDLILTRWNSTDVPYPHNKTIHQLFEEQVAKTPNNIAVVYSGEDEDGIKTKDNNKKNKDVIITYKELNDRASKLANYLIQNYIITPDTLVPLFLDRSEHMIISILAVLKAGGAYVPMAPDYPNERIKYILKDVQLANRKRGIKNTTVITNEIYTEKLLGLKKDVSIISVDSSELSEALSHELDTQPITSTSSSNLAYIIYTSGTTGNPKGVMQSHSNVMRLFTATDEWYRFGQDDVWTLFHSYVFDFTVWEIWGALLYGGKLVIPSHMVTRDLYAFYNLCKKEKVTVLNQTPSAFYQLIDIATQKASGNQNNNNELLPDLKYIIFGGEALNLSQLKPWFDLRGYNKPKLINMYGITETTVHVTYKEIALQDLDKGSYIGKRIPDLTTYVLSPSTSLTPLPIGAIGELYVGGTGLARGYLNNEELTKEKFIPNPFQTAKEKADTATYEPMGRNSRLYKTGDLVRWLPDGNLEYIGRTDFQVKIRGYRIELGEIESVLGSHLEVKQCVVLANEHKADGVDDSHYDGSTSFISSSSAVKYLVAYYTTDTGSKVDDAALISYLSSRLPDYMVPSVFVHLEKFPLTINGKLDRKALPKPEGREGLEVYQAPEGLIENSLASIWKELLQVERVGRNDNFFHLGGNSLLLVKMFYMIKKLFNVQVSIKDIHRTESLASLADIISTSTARREDTQINNIMLDINKTKAKPMFLIHPIGGLSLSYVPLKKIWPKQHIIGINDPYFGHESSCFSSLTDMSSHYVDVIKTFYDPNNCILGGWSFGGEIAYRMACQLEQDNKKISKLILFDSFTPEVHNLLVEENDEQSDKQKSDVFFEQSTKRNNALRKDENLPKFNGQLYLIKAIVYDSSLPEINKEIISQQKDNGWGEYCDNITVANVNLSHPELFEEETLHILMQEIRNIF